MGESQSSALTGGYRKRRYNLVLGSRSDHRRGRALPIVILPGQTYSAERRVTTRREKQNARRGERDGSAGRRLATTRNPGGGAGEIGYVDAGGVRHRCSNYRTDRPISHGGPYDLVPRFAVRAAAKPDQPTSDSPRQTPHGRHPKSDKRTADLQTDDTPRRRGPPSSPSRSCGLRSGDDLVRASTASTSRSRREIFGFLGPNGAGSARRCGLLTPCCGRSRGRTVDGYE